MGGELHTTLDAEDRVVDEGCCGGDTQVWLTDAVRHVASDRGVCSDLLEGCLLPCSEDF